MHPSLFAVPVRLHSPGAALVREGVWTLSHSSLATLSQSCHLSAAPSFPLREGGGGLSSSLSPSAFAALLLQFCHFRKGPLARASTPVPFTFSGLYAAWETNRRNEREI